MSYLFFVSTLACTVSSNNDFSWLWYEQNLEFIFVCIEFRDVRNYHKNYKRPNHNIFWINHVNTSMYLPRFQIMILKQNVCEVPKSYMNKSNSFFIIFFDSWTKTVRILMYIILSIRQVHS
jgi:hypothetical protein